MNVDPTIALVIVAYMVGMLFIGWRVSESAGDIADFILAKRGLGKWIVAMSLMFSAWSGYTFTGLIGVVYQQGLKAVWIGLASLGGLLFGVYLAYSMRLRPLSVAFDALTIPDILAKRYYSPNLVRVLGSLGTAVLYTGVVAPQLLATGVVLNVVTGMDVATGAWLGAVVVATYTAMGGFKAACYTDFVQGLVVMAAGIVLLVAAMALGGGLLPALVKADGVAGASFTDPIGTDWLNNTNLLLVFVFTWPGLLHAAVRFMSIESNRELKSTFWISVITSFVIAFPIILGTVMIRGLMPEVQAADRERMAFLFSLKHLPGWFTGLFAAGFIAAVQSTVDSALLVGANAFVRDFLRGKFMPNMSSQREVLYTRIALVVITVVAMGWILVSRETILGLIIFANSILASGLGVPLVFACWWKRATREGAVASMILGPACVIFWKLSGMSNLVVESIVGFLFSSAVMIVVSLLTAPPPADVRAKLDEALGAGVLGERIVAPGRAATAAGEA